MFYALARDKIDTDGYRFEHELVDIETLNRRAQRAELELTALSLHAYAYLADTYVLCTCGASMGDNYGPIVVSRRACDRDRLRQVTIAVPGTWTTAFLALRLWLGADFRYVVVPFDRILEVTRTGHVDQQPVDAGLVIHEGQLTYRDDQLEQAVDLGQWWMRETGLPLPLGANAIRKDLGAATIRDVNRLLLASIRYGLAHRDDALQYALSFARGLDRGQADRFVGMYVNDWTLDFGERGRRAVDVLLERGYQAGVIPHRQIPEFAG
jgi:1,4-dihydroxy-6-naphthoate synthase